MTSIAFMLLYTHLLESTFDYCWLCFSAHSLSDAGCKVCVVYLLHWLYLSGLSIHEGV